MLKVTKFVARTFDLDHIDLFWEIADFGSAQDVITAYNFTVLRSESPEGPFEALTPAFQDRYHFRDFSPNLLHKWRKLYYKLKIIHVPTSEELLVGSTTLSAEPDIIGLEIQRQEDTLLRQFTRAVVGCSRFEPLVPSVGVSTPRWGGGRRPTV